MARTVLLLAVFTLAGCQPPPPEGGVYVTSGFTDHVLRLDPSTGAVLDSIRIDPRLHETDEPHGIAVAPDGAYWYATLSHGEPTLWKFELPTNRLVGMTPLGIPGAARIGITPDGRRGFVPDYYRDGGGRLSQVAVVELTNLEITAQLTLCPAPHDAQPDASGARVAVTCSLSDEIVILDANTLDETARFAVDHMPGPPGEPKFKPLNVVWAPDGSRLFVSLHLAGEIRAFSPDGPDLGSVTVGDGPAQLAMSPDGSTLVVANRMDGSVSIVDVVTLAERVRIPIDGSFPHGVAMTANGHTAFVSFEGSSNTPGGVVAIDVPGAKMLWTTRAGAMTLGVAVVAR